MEYINLRAQKPDDDEFLLELFVSTRPDLQALSGLGEDEHKQFLFQQFCIEKEQVDKRSSNQQEESVSHFTCYEFNIVQYDDIPIGKYCISTEAECYHIVAIALLPQFQARGIGTELMNRLMKIARIQAFTITLQVAWYNYGAKAFYQKMGFRVIQDYGAFSEMIWPVPNTNTEIY